MGSCLILNSELPLILAERSHVFSVFTKTQQHCLCETWTQDCTIGADIKLRSDPLDLLPLNCNVFRVCLCKEWLHYCSIMDLIGLEKKFGVLINLNASVQLFNKCKTSSLWLLLELNGISLNKQTWAFAVKTIASSVFAIAILEHPTKR